jgi:predicted ribosome quality control (RQC) complex YloA/Tae2 family protein
MIQNYFFLNRFIIETSAYLSGAKIVEIFSQEKGKLIFTCVKKGKDFFLELCVIPGQSFINLRYKYTRAKKNTLNFFSGAIGEKMNSLQIADDDRIIKLECSHSQIYFAIRGKYTNVFCLNEHNEIAAFKNVDKDYLSDIKNEFFSKIFISEFNIPDLSLTSSNNYLTIIKKKYPMLGNEIIKEVKIRSDNNDNPHIILQNVLLEIKNTKPILFIDEQSGKVNIGFEKFHIFPFTKKEIFANVITAQNYHFSKKHFLENKQKKLNIVQKQIDKELKKLSNKINDLQGVIEKGTKEDEYKNIGNQLLINIKLLKTGMKEIEVKDIYGSGEKIKVKLNLKYSPKRNVDYYFEKAKAERIGFKKSQELLVKAKQDYEKFKKNEKQLRNIDSIKELDNIMKELKIKQQTHKPDKEDLREKFKHYVIDEKYHLFVGKDSKNNDLLTTRFAKQNDYWFHARSVSGSHVVLRVENTKEAIPKNVLKNAASLAAYHSKARTAGVVPVAFTLKKYVIKKKGYPIGTVHLLKEDVLLVKPEIPKNCEFLTNE